MGWRKWGRAPSDTTTLACWKCRGIIEEAAQLQVKPAALKVWREEIWSRSWWAAFIVVLLAAISALGVFGFSIAGGNDIGRTCELAIGTLLAVFSVAALTATWVISSKALAELRRLREEREETRRYS